MSFFEKLHALRSNPVSKTGRILREANQNRFNTFKNYDSNKLPPRKFFQLSETLSEPFYLKNTT